MFDVDQQPSSEAGAHRASVDPLADPLRGERLPSEALTDSLVTTVSSNSGPRKISESERQYEAERRAKKRKGSGPIDSEEIWASENSKSRRSVWRPVDGQGTDEREALWGSGTTEKTRGVRKSIAGELLKTKAGKAVVGTAKSAGKKVGDAVSNGASAAGKTKVAKGAKKAWKTLKGETEEPDGDWGDDKEKRAKERKVMAEIDDDREGTRSKEQTRKRDKGRAKHNKKTDREAARRLKAEEREASGKSRKVKNTADRKHAARKAGKTGSNSTGKDLDRLGVNVRSFGVGGIGDESGIHVGDYNQTHDDERWGGAQTGTQTNTYTASDGTKHSENTAIARAGSSTGGNVFRENNYGSVKSSAGAHGTAFAGAETKATSERITGPNMAGEKVAASAKAGAGSRGGAGARCEDDDIRIGSVKASGVVEAGAQGETFVGVESNTSAEVKAARGSASAKVRGGASVGGRVSGEGAAQAALKIGGTDVLAARGKAEGEAFAGAKADGSAGASASLTSGIAVEAKGEAMAGAKASGRVSGGVTAGFVDADVVAEGEAFAGARAEGEVRGTLSLAGADVGGAVEAFAGAKAQGEVGMEVGAGGLNLGKITVRGKAQAGAGGNANFNFRAMYGQLEAGAEAGAAVGVGLGAGMQVKGDFAFPIRLIADQVAKNGAKVAGDAATADATKGQWDLVPMGKQPKPGDDTVATGLSSKTPVPSVLKKLPKAVQERVADGQASANEMIEGAFKSTGKASQETATKALASLGTLVPTMVEHLGRAELAFGEAEQAIERLIASAGESATVLADTIQSVGSQAISDIFWLLARPPWDLFAMDFEAEVQRIIVRVHTMIDQIRQSIMAVIVETEALVLDVGMQLGRAVLVPIAGMANAAGSVVSEYGGTVTTDGSAIVDTLHDTFVLAETGVEVPGVEATLVLPNPVSPGLAPARTAMSDGQSFFDSAGEGLFGQVISDLAEPVIKGVFVDAPLQLTASARDVLAYLDGVQATEGPKIESTALSVARTANDIRDGFARFIGVEPPPRVAPTVPSLAVASVTSQVSEGDKASAAAGSLATAGQEPRMAGGASSADSLT